MDRFDFFCRAIADFGVKHVVIRQHNEEIFRRHFIPEAPCEQFSITKSFTSSAVGIAIEEGLFGLDDPVLPYFADVAPQDLSANWKELKVRHLLTMQMGFDRQYLMAFQRKTMKETDWLGYLFSQEMQEKPGRSFKYSNAGPYIAGRLIERTSGESLQDYMMPRIFEPLDIPAPVWGKDPEGHVFAASDMLLTTAEVSRFGQMWLDRGVYHGKRIIPEAWVKKVWDTVIATEEGESDYSFLFWRGRRETLSAVGRHGQYCVMIPEKEIVVAINSYDPGNENLMEYFWTYLYPYL